MEIYFDDNLIDQDYYMSYSEDFHQFDDTFFLGSSASVNASFQIPIEAYPGVVNNVRVFVDGELLHTLKVDEITINEDNTITLKLVDVLTHTATECDFSSMIDIQYDEEGEIIYQKGVKAKELLEWICSVYQIPYEEQEFDNQDVEIYSYDSTETGRTYLEMIAELAGCYIHIDNTGTLSLRKHEIDENLILTYDEVDSYKVGEITTIERVVFDNGVQKWESSSDESLYTLYLNMNNLFLQAATEEEFQRLWENIRGYTWCNIKINNCNKFFEDGKTIMFEKEDGNRIPIMTNYSRSYLGGFLGSYETDIHSSTQSETPVLDSEEYIRRIRTEINQLNGSLKIQAKAQAGLEKRTSTLEVNTENIVSLFQITGGSNLIKNSQLLLTDEVWDFYPRQGFDNYYHTEIGEGYNSSLIGQTTSLGNIVLKNCKIISTNDNITNIKKSLVYTLTYYYDQDDNTITTIKLISKATGNIIYEKQIDEKTNKMQKEMFSFTGNDTDYILEVNSETTLDGYFKLYDLMLNSGDSKSWEPAASEVYSTILKMSQNGLQVYSSGSNILTMMTSDGFQIRKATRIGDGIQIGEIISEFNELGLNTNELSTSKATIGKYILEDLILEGTLHHVEYFGE